MHVRSSDSGLSWPRDLRTQRRHGPAEGGSRGRLATTPLGPRPSGFPGGYYRRFIKGFGTIAAPLTQLLRKESFRWTEEASAAFYALKNALSTAPVLQLPDFNADFVVNCDASGTGFGAVLRQGAGPLAFFSKPFAPRHLKVAAYERELIGLVQAVRHWRPYLWG